MRPGLLSCGNLFSSVLDLYTSPLTLESFLVKITLCLIIVSQMIKNILNFIRGKGVRELSDGGGVEGVEMGVVQRSNQFNASSLWLRSFSRDTICEYRVSKASSYELPSRILMIAWRTQSSRCTRI